MAIKYRGLRNWRFQLAEDYEILTKIDGYEHEAKYFSIDKQGLVTIRSGYCWDGPSGPVFKTPATLRPALVHDVFYQLIRRGVVPISERKAVDDLFYRLCLDAGMSRFRAWYFYKAVRWFGNAAATDDEPYPSIKHAP